MKEREREGKRSREREKEDKTPFLLRNSPMSTK